APEPELQRRTTHDEVQVAGRERNAERAIAGHQRGRGAGMRQRLWTQQIVVDDGAVRGGGRLDLDQETGCVKGCLFEVQGLQRLPGTQQVETGRRNETTLLDDDIR